MSTSDPVADMLTRLRNGGMAQKDYVLIPSSKLKVAIARILQEEGYIKDYEIIPSTPQTLLKVALKYTQNRQPILSGLERISKPGRRVYRKKSEIPWVLSGLGIAIMSTPRGIMTGKEARRIGVGGEVLAYVW